MGSLSHALPLSLTRALPEITPDGNRVTKLDQILLNGNNICMVRAAPLVPIIVRVACAPSVWFNPCLDPLSHRWCPVVALTTEGPPLVHLQPTPLQHQPLRTAVLRALQQNRSLQGSSLL